MFLTQTQITPCLPEVRNKCDINNSNTRIFAPWVYITPPPVTTYINHCPNHGLGNIGLHNILTKL